MSKFINMHRLRWPSNWPRTPEPQVARFGDITIARAANALQYEIEHITNIKPDTIVITAGNGTAREPTREEIASPNFVGCGAAVYFTTHGPLVLACDRWRYVAHNLWALAKHVEAMRSIERWGVGTGKIAWAGYNQLPPSDRADPNAKPPPPPTSTKKPWRIVLGFDLRASPTREEIKARHRKLVVDHHPDANDTSHDRLAEINNARDEAYEEHATRHGAR